MQHSHKLADIIMYIRMYVRTYNKVAIGDTVAFGLCTYGLTG